MSTAPDLDLNLENLFQPAWAQGKSEPVNRFEKFTGNEGVKPERRSGGPGDRRGSRPGGFGGGQGGGGGRGENRGGGARSGAGGGGGGQFGSAPRGGRPGGRPGGRGGFGDRRDDRRDEHRERPEPPAPLPDLNVAFIPNENGVEQLARQIKVTGRAYPLFQIALLILQKPERYGVQLTSKKKDKPDAPVQKIFVCALDDTPWVSEEEAVAHVLKTQFATFYQTDRIATEPPKGVYTFVAQCGMSGVILGPPNYHDYQNQLRKLHAEKFARMPFDAFKARVKIVKDEAVVKKWVEEQSFKTEYTSLNVPEPAKFASMEEVEKHFRATHKDAIIKAVDSHIVGGVASRTLRSSGLQRLIRQAWEDQKHFPLPVATKLSQQFAQHGLQFFKVNKTVTHVSVARPQYLDLETNPVSDGIRRIVEFINSTPKCSRKKLVEALAPTAKVTAPAAPVPAEVAAPAAPVEGAAPTAEGEAGKPAEAKAAEVKAPPLSPEQTAVMVDLHWLIHQGHVLEFADGRMETAKKPMPKPPKPEKKPGTPVAETAAATPAEGTAVAAETEVTSTEPVAVEAETVTPADTGSSEPVAAAVPAAVPTPETANQKASEPPVT